MKVLIVSQYFAPENVPIPGDIAHGLAHQGHGVRVLTGYPNYPSGQLHPGYSQRWRHRERVGDIDICRVPLVPDHSRNPVRRIVNYLSFGLSAATARGFARGADVIYLYATQMTPAFGPWLWRLLGGAPYVLHVQDLWPDSILGSSLVGPGWAGRWIRRLLDPWLRSVYRHASAIVVIAPTMARTLAERGVSPDRIHLVYNWGAAAQQASPHRRDPHQGGISLLYAGNVGDLQDLDTVIEAVHLASDHGVRLTILGDGVALPRLKELTARLGAPVTFSAPVPRQEMAARYAAADFAVISLKDLPVFHGTIPSKFQDALSHGVPVITAVPGDLQAIVKKLGVGIAGEAGDARSLADVLAAAASQDTTERDAMSRRAQQAYRDLFSRDGGIERLAGILQGALGTPGGAP